jgi:hypothetical protein
MDISSTRLAAIYRYPVKGLSPERLARVDLTAGAYFPGDRLFAIENGPSGFDPAAPRHQPKIKFLMLMRNGALARLSTRYDDASGELVIAHQGREEARGNLATTAGRAAIAAFFARHMAPDLRGAPAVLTSPPGHAFVDSPEGHVSLLNLASIADLESRIGAPLDPLRFRANLYVEGLAPWAEFDLIGRTLVGSSGVRLRITQRIDRCAATDVDPRTGLRDRAVPKALMQAYGHIDCGVFCEIEAGGLLREGEHLRLQPDKRDDSPAGIFGA